MWGRERDGRGAEWISESAVLVVGRDRMKIYERMWP